MAAEEVVISRVDVIVVTYNSAAELSVCLDGLRPAACVGRLIVVDNASADGSAELAAGCGADVVVRNEANVGFARAVNRGLLEADAEAVLLLNPDACLTHGALERLRLTLESEPGAAIVAPLLRRSGHLTAGAGRLSTIGRRVALCAPLVGKSSFARPEYDLPEPAAVRARPVDVGYVYGAAMLVDRAFFLAADGLDERFFLFAEDEDLCRRAHSAGRRVLLEGRAVADHLGGADCPHPAATEAQRLFSTYRLFEKWRGRHAALLYAAGVRAAFRARIAAHRAAGRGDAVPDLARCAALFASAVAIGADPLAPAAAKHPAETPRRST